MNTTTQNIWPEDIRAWKATSEWSSVTTALADKGAEDYAELSRWFLWDKVGRAIRLTADSPSAAFERSLLFNFQPPSQTDSVLHRLRRRCRRLLSANRSDVQLPARAAVDFKRKSIPLVYVPVLSDRLKSAAAGLLDSKFCQVVVRHNNAALSGVDLFSLKENCAPDFELSDLVYEAIVDGLDKFNVRLLEQNAILLRAQLRDLTGQVRSARAEIEILQPDAILVHGDNHPPFQAYVMEARRAGIPAIMLQHGLDCEHFYLDEAYASAIAVWGAARMNRYREKSIRQPQIAVTGNPAYDQFRPSTTILPSGDYWLWLTRPHTPEKCYAPSRLPGEGVAIFHALVAALAQAPEARLIIKPHPYDYWQIYEQLIANHALEARISLSHKEPYELLPAASIVIAEDSTAGMDAMLYGKPLVHAHFAASIPVVPFVEYRAALPGFSKEELIASLLYAQSVSAGLLSLHSGQIDFLRDFAGPLDGNATNRFVAFVREIACQD